MYTSGSEKWSKCRSASNPHCFLRLPAGDSYDLRLGAIVYKPLWTLSSLQGIEPYTVT